MAVADDGPSNPDPNRDLESREPTLEDLRDLCRALNERGARYVRTAGGIDYAEASGDVVVHHVDGVPIPFASPRLLWRMKAFTHREKDAGDLVFLRYWFSERGEEPPATSSAAPAS